MKRYDVIVLGGGAAGLMCAVVAGQRGRRVLVIERSNKVGKKILMSGGGRCNFTNLNIEPDCYLSANPHFFKSALGRYTQWDFIEWMDRHGIGWHEKKRGQLFCDDSAKQVLGMLLEECSRAGVDISTRCEVQKVSGETPYKLESSSGGFVADSLVVATGGLSIPTLGGSGFGYQLAKQFELPVRPLRAGLVPLTFTDGFKEMAARLSGVSVPVQVTSGKQIFDENVLFTHRGLSGPAVLQISSYWQSGEKISVNLMPGRSAPALLKAAKLEQPKSLLRNQLSRHLPKKLVAELEQLWWKARSATAIAEIPDAVLDELGNRFNNWSLKPAGTEGYRTAEVTLGGVDVDRLSSKTMECKSHPGLYFVGEVVDVTGHLGGFNFQWAWSSGWVAGQVV